MKKFKQLVLLFLVASVTLVSCNKDDNLETEVSNKDLLKDFKNNENVRLKLLFSEALIKSLNESIELRTLIKSECNKMFNNDYEVLYQLIKDIKIKDNKSFRDLLISNYESPNDLFKLESTNPKLTFLIPQLPNNSFSAETWDTSIVPAIAIRVENSNDVPIVYNDLHSDILEGKYTPNFPVIVIKNNERIVFSNENQYKKLKTRELINNEGMSFKFLDDVFDCEKNKANRILVNVNSVEPKIVNAYNTYLNADGWHRDLIYYDITPLSPNGQFSYDFQEHIKSFRMDGSALNAYQKISDQSGDPIMHTQISNLNSSHWTQGFFEFKIICLVNAKNGIGEEIIKYISASGNQLFTLNYKQVSPFAYVLDTISINYVSLNIPIFNWDLNQYASTIKITVEEVDLTETTTLTDTRSVKFATNFSIDPTSGFLSKIGLKFGASLEQNATQTVQRSFTQSNDQLGDVIVNFADKIIIHKGRHPFTRRDYYNTREYSSGWYSIGIEPERVQ